MLYKQVRMMFMVAETPLHPGSGAETGLVDLPIQRERHTGFPKIEASTIKGCLRDLFSRTQSDQKIKGAAQDNSGQQHKANGDLVEVLFGPDTGRADEHAGALVFTDARILLFPVRSLKGVFAWTTSPLVLQRLVREAELAGQQEIKNAAANLLALCSGLTDHQAIIAQNSIVKVQTNPAKVVLEQFAFGAKPYKQAEVFAGTTAEILGLEDKTLAERLVVINDDSFGYLVRHATDVVTRVRVDDEKGTVVRGGLWTEEYLPQETVLWCLVMASDGHFYNEVALDSNTKGRKARSLFKVEAQEVMKKAGETLRAARVFLGGDQTVGKGLVRLCIVGGNDHGADR